MRWPKSPECPDRVSAIDLRRSSADRLYAISNEWRLALARDLLMKGDMKVGQIGLNIGYESEAAFSRAYKALFGHPPHAERKSHNRAQSSWVRRAEHS